MGITSRDVELLEYVMRIRRIESVIECGSQNLFLAHTDKDKPPFAREWYESRGIQYKCIDLAGDNKAMIKDLAFPITGIGQFDLVTDFGTGEHVCKLNYNAGEKYQFIGWHEGHMNSAYPEIKPTDAQVREGFYNFWKNKHDFCAPGGFILSVNPKTGNWGNHGYTWLDKSFYMELATMMGYYVHILSEHPAMGNTTDGWNIECLLEKMTGEEFDEFISFEQFQKCNQYPA
jgi:hypothetical protein